MTKNEDFGKYLHQTYPTIFSKELWIECNEGWYQIIEDLTKQIVELAAQHKADPNGEPRVDVVQIKEKFGGLRYYLRYYDLTDEQIQQFEFTVRAAEMKSYETCEDCGAPAKLCSPKRYWMKTICLPCQEKYEMGDTPNGI